MSFLNNRQNPGIIKIFLLLLGCNSPTDLLVNHDRCAFYRPTLARSEWKTGYTYPGLHLDFHPSSYFDYKKLLEKREMLNYSTTDDFVAENNLFCKPDVLEIQAVINLIDNKEEDGCYQCAPGFHKLFNDWYLEKKERKIFDDSKDLSLSKNLPPPEGVYHFSHTDKTDMKYLPEPICIIFWSQFLAHGTKPNNSNNPRCIQFIKAFPKRMFSKERLKKRGAALRKLLAAAKFTGRAVFGI